MNYRNLGGIFVVFLGMMAGCSLENSSRTRNIPPPPVGVKPAGADNPQARDAAVREAQKEAALKAQGKVSP